MDSNGKFVAGRIQLYAATHFKDTTNSGNEYKVWISRDPKFSSGSSKTDNFKVKVKHLATPVLEIQKFNDWNKDGIKQPDEPYVLWSVTITNITTGASWVQKLDGYGTGRDGTWKGLVAPGIYKIEEAAEEGWLLETKCYLLIQ